MESVKKDIECFFGRLKVLSHIAFEHSLSYRDLDLISILGSVPDLEDAHYFPRQRGHRQFVLHLRGSSEHHLDMGR